MKVKLYVNFSFQHYCNASIIPNFSDNVQLLHMDMDWLTLPVELSTLDHYCGAVEKDSGAWLALSIGSGGLKPTATANRPARRPLNTGAAAPLSPLLPAVGAVHHCFTVVILSLALVQLLGTYGYRLYPGILEIQQAARSGGRVGDLDMLGLYCWALLYAACREHLDNIDCRHWLLEAELAHFWHALRDGSRKLASHKGSFLKVSGIGRVGSTRTG